MPNVGHRQTEIRADVSAHQPDEATVLGMCVTSGIDVSSRIERAKCEPPSMDVFGELGKDSRGSPGESIEEIELIVRETE
jgi:hypothetical protein